MDQEKSGEPELTIERVWRIYVLAEITAEEHEKTCILCSHWLPSGNEIRCYEYREMQMTRDKWHSLALLMLTDDTVRQKWERIKKRLKTRKDGHKIAALLGFYAITDVDINLGLPVVTLQACSDIYYKALRNPDHHVTIEWAMEVELGLKCRLRLLPPSSGVSQSN